MNTLTSRDGTTIAFDKQGTGPALILVDGAMVTRSSGSKPELAQRLARTFTVYSYDRRGRGDSGDTQPYAVEREVEDLAALIECAGGSAALYGHSSGGCLAFEASIALGGIVNRLAIFEVPYNDDPAARKRWRSYVNDLTHALAANRRGDAVALFMRYVGTPAERIEAMRRAPVWRAMEEIAPTLAFDHAAVIGEDCAVPVERAAQVRVPALVMCGGSGAPFMLETAKTLSRAIPGGELRIIDRQTHDVQPEAVAPVLVEFFDADS